MLGQYPVATVTGPRQSGKTTLVRMSCPDFNYANLENPEIRQLAENDPNAFFNRFKTPLIIDEIQRVPILLSYIQVMVDKLQRMGLFVLTGSHQLKLGEAISQSLAGRTAVLRLLPFSLKELQSAKIGLDRDSALYTGFMPGIYQNNLNPTKAYRNYFQTYVERDVRLIMQIKNLGRFENFVRLLAGRVGQVVNLHSLSGDLGVSSTTLEDWLSVLESSFLIFRLPPYFENFGKRIIKSPKLYFTDVGLATYLLGIENIDQISRDPLLGGLFENMVVMEAVKTRLNRGFDPALYYWRDNNKNEIDMIIKKQYKLVPVEIKASMTFHDSFLKGIRYFQKISNKSQKGALIYSGSLQFENDIALINNFNNVHKLFG